MHLTRRTLLKTTALTGAASALALPTTTVAAAPAAYAHPGLLHTAADLTRMATKVKANSAPYTAGYAKLTANRHAQTGWNPRPQQTVYRGAGSPQNYTVLYNDLHAAYQNGLRYHVSGDEAHADTAVKILNSWSGKLTSLQGSADRFLAAGLYGYQAANAAELVRDHPDFELDRFRTMLTEVFAPISDSFLLHHNNAVVTNYWPNWDLTALACVLATGIFCDDRAQVARAVDYFKNGDGLGAVRNAIPVVREDGLAEWLEAGRDQGHTLLGIGLMGTVCEMAWNQGIDLYGYDDSRFLKGAQYVAKWCLGEPVPYTPNTRRKGAIGGWSGQETASAAASVDPNTTRPVWAMIANHYTKRRGLDASYVTRVAAKSAPEGGGGDYGPNSGGYDQLGFGTLAFTRDKATRDQRLAGAGAGTGAGATNPAPGASAAPGPNADASTGTGTGTGTNPTPDHPKTQDLAATGPTDLAPWAAATGITTLAAGFLLLRRRNRNRELQPQTQAQQTPPESQPGRPGTVTPLISSSVVSSLASSRPLAVIRVSSP
ncbi:alginate lyase family protein, partial [Streptomyces acidiscabies]|uniref:alginate lyase family protein n=1 Tax=Streptomyces acidiscabies TaxID=42234 RepID=UPI000A6BFDB3